MTQSKLGSFYEAVINTMVGFGLSLVLNLILLPAYGCSMSVAHNVQITLFFTALSIARGYFIRRYFNARIHQLAERMAGN